MVPGIISVEAPAGGSRARPNEQPIGYMMVLELPSTEAASQAGTMVAQRAGTSPDDWEQGNGAWNSMNRRRSRICRMGTTNPWWGPSACSAIEAGCCSLTRLKTHKEEEHGYRKGD